jgi:hypothetical protein
MFGFGSSKAHGSRKRAGRFGLGGKASQIRITNAGIVQVGSVVDGMLYSGEINWEEMCARDKFVYKTKNFTAIKTEQPNGTKLTLRSCRKLDARIIAKIKDDIGYSYMDTLKSKDDGGGGVTFALNIDGKKHPIRPYQEPSYADVETFAFQWRNLLVEGRCGLLEDGIVNDHPGWSIHWGPHRLLGCFIDPAGGKNPNRLQSHVYIPSAFKGVNLTKDGFADYPDDLFVLLAEHCARIIDLAHDTGTDQDMAMRTESVERYVEGLLIQGLKGKRTRKNESNGTVEPTGTGAEHEHFNEAQPGTKTGEARDRSLIPQRFRFMFDDQIKGAFDVQLGGPKDRMFASVTLNHSRPGIKHLFTKNDPIATGQFCLALIIAKKKIAQRQPSLFGEPGRGLREADLSEYNIEEVYDYFTGFEAAQNRVGIPKELVR